MGSENQITNADHMVKSQNAAAEDRLTSAIDFGHFSTNHSNLSAARNFVDQKIDQGSPFQITRGDRRLAFNDNAGEQTESKGGQTTSARLRDLMKQHDSTYRKPPVITAAPTIAPLTDNTAVNRPVSPLPPTTPERRVEPPKLQPEKPRESTLAQKREAFKQEMLQHKDAKGHLVPHYTTNEVETAIKKADETQSTLVVDIGYAGCTYCTHLNGEVFQSFEKAQIGKFVPLHLDSTSENYEGALAALSQSHRQIPSASGAPHVVAFNGSGKRIFNQVGFSPGTGAAYKKRLQAAIDHP